MFDEKRIQEIKELSGKIYEAIGEESARQASPYCSYEPPDDEQKDNFISAIQKVLGDSIGYAEEERGIGE